MLKKTLLASAIAVVALSSVNAQADVAVTEMLFVGTMGTTPYVASGTLNDAGTGTMNSVTPFFGHAWSATQQTGFLSSTDSWANNATKSSGVVSGQGFYDYDTEIAGLTGDQRAVGIFFNWFGNNDIAVLEIFDCVANVCTGQGVPMANGPFGNGNADGTPSGLGSVAKFNGTGSVVPVPAAAWLMGSGLLGLVGVARRRKQA